MDIEKIRVIGFFLMASSSIVSMFKVLNGMLMITMLRLVSQ